MENSEMKELIDILHEKKCSCVIRKGNTIRTFNQRGVADLYDLVMKEAEFLNGAEIADKVVGKGAAALMTSGGIARLHADVISKPAMSLFEKNNIEVTYTTLTDGIINRKGDGPCPVESMCSKTDDVSKMVEMIGTFIENMKNGK